MSILQKSFFIILTVLTLGLGSFFAEKKFVDQPKPVSGVTTSQLGAATEQSSPTVHNVEDSIKIPLKIRIPKLKIDAAIESVGLDSKKRMDVPKDADNVAWYNLGVKPGQVGNAVFAGHLDKASGDPAVFFDIKKLVVGDEIEVEDESGKQYTFKVTALKRFEWDKFPISEIFGPSSGKHLNLITCGGQYDKTQKNYSHRDVVYSQMIE